MNSKSEIIRKLKINEIVARKIRLLLMHDNWASLPANPQKEYTEDWLRGVGENTDQLIELSKNYEAEIYGSSRSIDPSKVALEDCLPSEPLSEVFTSLVMGVVSHLQQEDLPQAELSSTDIKVSLGFVERIEEIQKKVDEFLAMARNLDEFSANLSATAKKASGESERQAEDIGILTAENDRLTIRISQLETNLMNTIREDKKEIKELKKGIAEKGRENNRLADELTELQNEKEGLVEENKNLLAQESKLRNENYNLSEQLKTSRQNEIIKKQKQELTKLTAENEKIKVGFFPATSSTNQDFNQLLLNIIKNSSPKLQGVKDFDEVIQTTKSWIVDDEPNFWNLISQVSKITQLFQVAERGLKEKNDQLTNFEEQIIRLNEELEEKEALQIKTQQEVEKKENELVDFLTEGNKQISELREENDELKIKNYELQEEIEGLKGKYEIEGSHLLAVQRELEIIKSPVGNATPITLMGGGGFLGSELKVVEQSEQITQLRKDLENNQAKLKNKEIVQGFKDFSEQLKEIGFSCLFDSRRTSCDDSLISGSMEATESRQALKEELTKKNEIIEKLNSLLVKRTKEIEKLKGKISQSSASERSEGSVPPSPVMRIIIPRKSSSSDSLRNKVFVDSPSEMDRGTVDLRTDLELKLLENASLQAEIKQLKEENERLKTSQSAEAENSVAESEKGTLTGAEWQAILEKNLTQQAINIRDLKQENKWLMSRFKDYMERRAEKDALAPSTISFDAIYQSWLPGETKVGSEKRSQEKFERYNQELGLTRKITRDISKIKEYLGNFAKQIEQAELNWQELWKSLPKTTLENDYQEVAGQAEVVSNEEFNEEENVPTEAELVKQYGTDDVILKAKSVLQNKEEWEVKVQAEQIKTGVSNTVLIELATKNNEINSKFIQQQIEDLDEESSSFLQDKLEELIKNNEKKIIEQQQEHEEADKKFKAFSAAIGFI